MLGLESQRDSQSGAKDAELHQASESRKMPYGWRDLKLEVLRLRCEHAQTIKCWDIDVYGPYFEARAPYLVVSASHGGRRIDLLRAYVCRLVKQYLNLSRYIRGQERMPFQARELMRYLLLVASHSNLLQRVAKGHQVVNTQDLLMLEIISCISMLLAGWASVKIYRFAAPQGRVPYLPWAILVILCLFAHSVRLPMPSLTISPL